MTREEAIRELKIFNGTTRIRLSANFWEALNMAIKALEQEPCEDCVSRQAVLERINDWWGITSTSGEPTLCDYIRELPPVTPTRKKGKWIKEYVGCMYDVCSECRQKIVSGYFEFNYCPNCGTEMESEE